MSQNMRLLVSGLACFVLAGKSIAQETSTRVCPILGPAFPVPTGLSSDEVFQTATKAFDDALTSTLETGLTDFGSFPFNATTISIGLFSTAEDGLVHQWHYTDPSISNSTVGTRKVDADSVYRIGSISKLLTVYLFLIREGDKYFNEPITKFIPELAQAAAAVELEDGVTPDWNEITIGQLASHISGIARDFGVNEISYPWNILPGLPPLSTDQVPGCNRINPDGSFKPCDVDEFLRGLVVEPAVLHSASSPVYSNNGFMLLGLALENITGLKLEDLFTESLVDALDLHHTSYDVPNNTQNAVIPGNATIAGWDSHLGALAPAGAYFSSTHDIATIGKAILNSTLLSKAQTRRWLKPTTFTSNVNVSLGAPWEIFRAQVGGRSVDMFTKNGGWGAYATLLILIPDYNFGISILTASELTSSITSGMVYVLSEIITSAILPGLESAARQQANARFAGQYTSSSLNSSVTIEAGDQPGLRVTQWISNGTDFLQALKGSDSSDTSDTYLDLRLQPNQFYAGNRVGFTGVFQTLPSAVISGPFDLTCLSWGGVDSTTYGNVGIEAFVFEIDPSTGKAISVQPKAMRITLEKNS